MRTVLRRLDCIEQSLPPKPTAQDRHIVSVGKGPDRRCYYEERPGEAPPNQERSKSENVMTIFFVRAQYNANEIGHAME